MVLDDAEDAAQHFHRARLDAFGGAFIRTEPCRIVPACHMRIGFGRQHRHPTQRRRPFAGAGRRQQGRFRVPFGDGEEDGEALGQHGAVGQDQGGQPAERIDGAVLVAQLVVALQRHAAQLRLLLGLGQRHLDHRGTGAGIAVENIVHAPSLPRGALPAPMQLRDAAHPRR
ncbi:hypothetical protein J4558_26805 [Leptolyngbya sp. 15MV]|nr:hypothetical protein J4558_26805 [Leptolyngbya sp. 15MV]